MLGLSSVVSLVEVGDVETGRCKNYHNLSKVTMRIVN